MLKRPPVDFHWDGEDFVFRKEAASCTGSMMRKWFQKFALFSLLTFAVIGWQSAFATTKSSESAHKTTTTKQSSAKKHSSTKVSSNSKSKKATPKLATTNPTSSSSKSSHKKTSTLAANKKTASKTTKKNQSGLLAKNTSKKTTISTKTKTTSKEKHELASNSKTKTIPIEKTKLASSSKTKSSPTEKTKLATTNKTKITSKEKTKLASNSSSRHPNTLGLHATNIRHGHHGKKHPAYSKTIRKAIEDIPEESRYFATEIKHSVANLAGMVDKTIDTMRYSHYQMGGTQFDPNHGVYVVDCSSYVDRLLNQVNPHAYFSLVNRTGTTRPTTEDYYNFFNNLAYQNNHYWRKVDNASSLQAGDILVFRSGWNGGGSGHVMVVMNKPVRHDDVLLVRVADSASSGHSQDTRPAHASGIGIGTMLLKMDGTKPAAYAWRVGAPWENVHFAMGRPIA